MLSHGTRWCVSNNKNQVIDRFSMSSVRKEENTKDDIEVIKEAVLKSCMNAETKHLTVRNVIKLQNMFERAKKWTEEITTKLYNRDNDFRDFKLNLVNSEEFMEFKRSLDIIPKIITELRKCDNDKVKRSLDALQVFIDIILEPLAETMIPACKQKSIPDT